MEILAELFPILAQHGVVLNSAKTELLQKDITYLGFSISQNKIRIKNDYTSKIQKWPTPHDLKTLEAFFGFVSYYQSFMLKFAETAYPLTELKKLVRNKTGKFEWTEQCQSAFNELKQTMLKDPIRAFPIYDITLSKDISPFYNYYRLQCTWLIGYIVTNPGRA